MVDVYHTFFGIAGLSLLGALAAGGVPHVPIDPVYALPAPLVAKLGLPRHVLPEQAPPPAAAAAAGGAGAAAVP